MAVARVTEIIASSPKGFQEAITEGFKRAAKTLHGITGLEVVSQKAKIVDGKITEYRVRLNIFFILD